MVSVRYSHDDHEHHGDPAVFRIDRCPYREQIGYGMEGEKQYFDDVECPAPAVRYKRETPDVLVGTSAIHSPYVG